MPRDPRIHVTGGTYHVTMRGNNRAPLFFCNSDRRKYSELVYKAAEVETVDVLAYCWMTNHVHLAVRVGESPLGRFVQRVSSQYARYLNWRRKASGHVFERRYFAVFVDVDEYLLQLVRYIDLNPVRANIVNDPEEYRWGSHRHYLRGTGPSWLVREPVLSLFSADTDAAIAEYRSFVLTPQDPAIERDLPAILAAREPRESTGESSPGYECRGQGGTDNDLNQLLDEVCARYRVSRADITGSNMSKALSNIRQEIIEKAIVTYGATYVEVGRCLNRSGAAVSQLLKRSRKAD